MLGRLILPPDAPADAADRLLASVAARLTGEGVWVAGVVQVHASPTAGPAEMRARLLGAAGGEVVISLPLGPGSSGCRLDPGALEEAAQRVTDALPNAQLVLISKFGRQEAAGRGFRPVLANALVRGLPSLVHVGSDVGDAFAAFTEGMAMPVPADEAEPWCRAALG